MSHQASKDPKIVFEISYMFYAPIHIEKNSKNNGTKLNIVTSILSDFYYIIDQKVPILVV